MLFTVQKFPFTIFLPLTYHFFLIAKLNVLIIESLGNTKLSKNKIKITHNPTSQRQSLLPCWSKSLNSIIIIGNMVVTVCLACLITSYSPTQFNLHNNPTSQVFIFLFICSINIFSAPIMWSFDPNLCAQDAGIDYEEVAWVVSLSKQDSQVYLSIYQDYSRSSGAVQVPIQD